MRRKIPSIESLLAFEAAAKYQSFTRAAEELSLTQSAICKQIASLEQFLEIKLFRRVKRHVELTDAGKSYAAQVQESLESLEQQTLSVMAHEGRGSVIELAAIPTFTTRWLIPRLSAFNQNYPDITLNITTRAEPFLFTDTPFDAAIHFGSDIWPGAKAEYLFGEETVPVCHPDLLSGLTEDDAVCTLPLLHQSSRHDAWRKWFSTMGLHRQHSMAGPRFELFSMLVEAAKAKLGMALVPRFLIQEELNSGTLAIPCNRPLKSELGYYLVYPENKKDYPALQAFSQWLLSQAATYQTELLNLQES
ncbi:LysR family transcriptional regulator [Leeia sp. TBRC 13508]|uniref:LysR family transcriptional regulator n=1 Tax=Leeia speluncae TaxID=2884804 RepID=A0ABS8D1W6_9NEIS|nr:LysR substrate-binding domain-containing protein [Leeia speluncae]MCB6182179.1 LysR family transcriptional regulator [Leeia speluncae]